MVEVAILDAEMLLMERSSSITVENLNEQKCKIQNQPRTSFPKQMND
jgi:hypothetical protein